MSGSFLPYVSGGNPKPVYPHGSLNYLNAAGTGTTWGPVSASGPTGYSTATLEFWFRFNSLPTAGTWYGICSSGSAGTGVDGIAVSTLGWRVGNGLTVYGTPPNPNQWYAIAITKTGATTGNFFLDGVLVTSFTSAPPTWVIFGTGLVGKGWFWGTIVTSYANWANSTGTLSQISSSNQAFTRLSSNVRYTANYTVSSSFPPFYSDASTVYLNYVDPAKAAGDTTMFADSSPNGNNGVVSTVPTLAQGSAAVPF